MHAREDDPSSGDLTTPEPLRSTDGGRERRAVATRRLTLTRLTAKATITHYRAGLLGTDHEWKIGGQIEEVSGHGDNFIPTGVRFVDRGGEPSRGRLDAAVA